MSHLKQHASDESGFSLVELLVVLAVTSVVVITFSSFFTNYLILYSNYQKDGSNFTELAQQSQRIAQVLRGVTDIVSANDNDLVAYSYFSPVDSKVSQVHYYLNTDKTILYVDVTAMTADPPSGTPITNSKKTYTLLSKFYQPAGGKLFNYTDASATLIATPVAEQHSIIGIQVNLAESASHTQNGQNLSINVSLRNRKTNL